MLISVVQVYNYILEIMSLILVMISWEFISNFKILELRVS